MKRAGTIKRILAFVLSLLMIVALVPVNGMTVHAKTCPHCGGCGYVCELHREIAHSDEEYKENQNCDGLCEWGQWQGYDVCFTHMSFWSERVQCDFCNAHEHNWVYERRVEANGMHFHTGSCTICGIDAPNHGLNCNTDGKYGECSYCGYLSGHTHEKGLHHDGIPATCTTDGQVEYWDCTGCGDKLNLNGEEITNIITSAGHSWGEWNNGTRSCTRSGCTVTETCTHSGVTSSTCPTCGEEGIVYFVAVGGNPKGFAENEEFYSNLFDGNTDTKWCCDFDYDEKPYVIIEVSEPVEVKGYTITTAMDAFKYYARNPVSWTLVACNDLDCGSWEVIADESDGELPQDGCESKTYSITNVKKAYKYYKWNITSTAGDTILQVSEFALIYNTHIHEKGTHHDAVSPTCTVPGSVEYWDCSECGKKFNSSSSVISDITVAALNHTGGNATCQTLKVCERCGTSYGELADHNWSSWNDGARACQTSGCTVTETCTHDGATDGTCPTCGKEDLLYYDVVAGNPKGFENKTTGTTEFYTNLFDGKTDTKWCCDFASGSTYVIIKASEPVKVSEYIITTGNDTSSNKGRNPKSWTLEACNDCNESTGAGTWVTIDTVTDGDMPTDNCTSKTYSITNVKKAYKYYKWNINSTAGDTILQVSEFGLIGECDIVSLSYTYPVYNTENDPTSGIKEWMNGTQNCIPITEDTTTLGTSGATTWYVINSAATDNLTIDGAITVNGNVNIIIADGAKLTVNGSSANAGINVTGAGNSLTIYAQTEGNGQLVAKGGHNGAGIGGGDYGHGSKITINGGNVVAEGGNFGAGIGGGNGAGSGSDIIINGGVVTAQGGNKGAGIGGGNSGGTGKNILINGGTVTALGSNGGAGIGGGNGGTGENITINSGCIVIAGSDKASATATALNGSKWESQLSNKEYVYIYAHTHSFSEEWSSDASGHWHACTSDGAIEFCLEESGAAKAEHSSWQNGKCAICGYACTHESITEGVCDKCGMQGLVSYRYPVYNSENDPTSGIKEWKNDTKNCIPITENTTTLGTSGTTTWYVVNSVATADLTISTTITVNGNVNIIIADGAKLTVNGTSGNAGINVTGDNSLTVYGQTEGNGQLVAKGGNNGAGIGGGCDGDGSNIAVNGGTVTAIGGSYGAGIGGGSQGNGSDITINGGTVTVTGGYNGAGIGGGCRGDGSNIAVNGGTVTAIGGSYGAGIGGGSQGNGSDITINGGTVTATGGKEGAGIGGGSRGTGSDITINEETVIAIGGDGGAGIGGGYGGDSSRDINIASELSVKVGDNLVSATLIADGEKNCTDLLKDKKTVCVFSNGEYYSGYSLSLSGDIGINIYMELDAKAKEDSNAKLVVNNKGTETEILLTKAEEVVDETSNDASGSTQYVFHYSIPAKDYSNVIICKFVSANTEDAFFAVRVSDYIDYIQANESKDYDEKIINLVNAMEKYCEEAVSYFAGEYESEKYVYSDIANKLSSYSADYSKMGEGYLGTSLILNGKVTIRHYYSDSTVFTQLGVTDYKSVGNIYYYEIADISPADYDAVRSNGYSVYSYILAGLSNDGCSNNFKNLLCAMYEFSVAAEDYV